MALSKEDIVLLALQDGEAYSPVQVQKLLFLIEKKASLTKKPLFHFSAYHYGPFDKEIYDILDKLSSERLVNVHCNMDQRHRKYCLTELGLSQALEKTNKIEKSINKYIKDLALYVKSQSFPSLVSAIYKEFPEMKANSIFNK